MGASNVRGVVAAGHPLTARAAADQLRCGGTAVDAAIAALAMACVTEPVLCSPGGGGFAMLRDPESGAVSLIDFFPQTPKQRRSDGSTGVTKIFADFGTTTQAFRIGPGTTASPGFFAGLAALHGAGGSIPLPELFAPAARAARDGILITPFQHYLAMVVRPIVTATDRSAALFAPAGDVLEPGATFTNPGLADALEVLATAGFCDSDVGRAVLNLQARGNLTHDDLQSYRAVERAPLSLRVGEATVYLNPPPAAGGTLVAHSIGQLSEPDQGAFARALAATDRAKQEASGELGIDLSRLRQQGTTHISVIDRDGAACAVTTSNGAGNGEIAAPFGFMPNNILGEDDVNPAGPAAWPLDARLSSGMCPTLVEGDDGSITALGSGGSNRIRSAIAQVILQLCLKHAELDSAIEAPRMHIENGHLDFEDFFDDDTRSQLTSMFSDHRAWPDHNLFYGGVHAARLDGSGILMGAGDQRRDGVALVV